MGVRRKTTVTSVDLGGGIHQLGWTLENERTGLVEVSGSLQAASALPARNPLKTLRSANLAALQALTKVEDLPYFFIVSHPALRIADGMTNPYENFTSEVTVKGTWVESYETSLAGSNNDLSFTSKDTGYSGVSIRYFDPGTETATETVEVIGEAITVTLRSVSSVLSTASQVKAALEASGAANALITVANASGNDGSGVVTEMDWRWLEGADDEYTVSSSIKNASAVEVATTSDVYANTVAASVAMEVVRDAVYSAMRSAVTVSDLRVGGNFVISIPTPFENLDGLTLDPPYAVNVTPSDAGANESFAYTVTDGSGTIASGTLVYPDATLAHVALSALRRAGIDAVSASFTVANLSNFTLRFVPPDYRSGLLGTNYTIDGAITFLDPDYRVQVIPKDNGTPIGSLVTDYPPSTLAKRVYAEARNFAEASITSQNTVADIPASAEYDLESYGEGIDLGVDQYGGLLACHSPNGGTGWFTVEKVNGRWWLKTPEGNYMFARAIANTATAPGNNDHKFSKVWQVDADAGPAFVDVSSVADSDTQGDWDIFPASEAVGDYVAFGGALKFNSLGIVSTGGVQGVGGTVAWEYWNGSSWAALTVSSDQTSGFTAGLSAERTVNWSVPGDWATTSLNGETALYYIRARVTGVYSTNPVCSRGYWRAGYFTLYKEEKYGAQDATWAIDIKHRLREHGFNSVGYGDHADLRAFGTPAPQGLFMPHNYIRVQFGAHAVKDNGNVLGENIKNVAFESGWNTSTMPDIWDPKFELYCKKRWMTIPINRKEQADSKWLLGYLLDEGDSFRVFNIDNNHVHPGWVCLCGPPTQSSGDWHGASLSHTDTTNYSKQEMNSFLQARYGTIGALNTAWGSSYSTFGANGGWRVGDGLLDEDGTLGASWIGNKVELVGANATFIDDMDDFMVLTFQRFHRIVKESIRQDDINHMIGSIYAYGARRPRQAETLVDPVSGQPYIDFCLVGGRPRDPGEAYPLKTLWEATYEAGIPLMTAAYFITSEIDSDVTFGGGGSGGSLPDQPSRGKAMRSHWDRCLEFSDTVSGDALIVGHQWWQLTDNWAGEGRNYGIFTLRQNNYDGVENTTAGGTDKRGFPIIPEDIDPPVSGDFFTECVKGNKHCDKRMVSLYFGGS